MFTLLAEPESEELKYCSSNASGNFTDDRTEGGAFPLLLLLLLLVCLFLLPFAVEESGPFRLTDGHDNRFSARRSPSLPSVLAVVTTRKYPSVCGLGNFGAKIRKSESGWCLRRVMETVMPVDDVLDIERDSCGRKVVAFVNWLAVLPWSLRSLAREVTAPLGREESATRVSGRARCFGSSSSIPGRMESGLSSGQRADLMHWRRVISMRQAGR